MKNNLLKINVAILLCAACNNKAANNETAAKELNDRSLQCIHIMNEADAKKTVALTNGDAAAAAVFQKTMDSAALENVKIGQQLSELKVK